MSLLHFCWWLKRTPVSKISLEIFYHGRVMGGSDGSN